MLLQPMRMRLTPYQIQSASRVIPLLPIVILLPNSTTAFQALMAHFRVKRMRAHYSRLIQK